MTLELRHALDNAYDVFARYNAPDYLELGNFQLRDLSIERWHELDDKHDVEISMYSDDGIMLRWFLPRWLEWLIDEEDSLTWESWSLGFKLARAKWRDWPDDEVAALRAVFLSWTREAIARPGVEPDLHFLSEAKADIAPHLDLWLRSNPLAVAEWLWTVSWMSQPNERLWATSSQLENWLETAFFNNPDGEHAQLFSRSIELIRSLRAL